MFNIFFEFTPFIAIFDFIQCSSIRDLEPLIRGGYNAGINNNYYYGERRENPVAIRHAGAS